MYITFQEVLIMSNSIFEDALLLGVGGIVGLIAGAALMSEDDDEEEEACDMPKAKGPSIEALFASLSEEAQQAVASCETEEEREDVRNRIHQAIRQMGEDLEKRSAQTAAGSSDATTVDEAQEAATFVNLEDGETPKPEESFSDVRVKKVLETLSKISDTLDLAVADRPVADRPSVSV